MLKKLKDWLIKKLGGYTHEEMGMFSESARDSAYRQARLEWQNLMSDEVHIVKEVPLHEADAAALTFHRDHLLRQRQNDDEKYLCENSLRHDLTAGFYRGRVSVEEEVLDWLERMVRDA